ncbi:MAG TPA: copper amine oxidase N-terminal domain-containing protein [Candidatus Eremiobacteraceae bacterium]|nr:copper amine oxidase N-terminal domain-containing protein [Candidatus Eremiobacteraceae bacterium]
MIHAVRAILTFVALALIFSITQAGAVNQPMAISVVVNGKRLAATALEIEGDKVYVALRPVAQILGADVTTNAQAKTVTITTLLRQVILHFDDPWATINGQRVLLSAPAHLSGKRVVLPLRAIAQAFDASVLYDPQTHTVNVSAALHRPPSGRPTLPPLASGRTLSGTVLSVAANETSPSLLVQSGGTNYTLSVPTGTVIAFRDVHGAVTGNGVLSQVRPGDALIVTLDASGHLIAMADIFASINGTIAAVADQSMVLENGRVISADPTLVAVTLGGIDATFASLRPGDKVSVRADPVSGKVRDVVALRPGGLAASAVSTPAPGTQGTGGAAQIKSVRDNAAGAFRAGQVLSVAAEGTPGASASFDLSNIIIDNMMRETRPGHYEGQYGVTVGTNLIDAPILIRLSRSGETAVAEARNPLNIITTPPSVKDAAPLAGTSVNTSRPNIFAAFLTVGNKGMDPATLQMSLNGRDVTSRTTRTGTFISYYPPSELRSQTVEVEVKGTDIAGNGLDYTWTFLIAGK